MADFYRHNEKKMLSEGLYRQVIDQEKSPNFVRAEALKGYALLMSMMANDRSKEQQVCADEHL
jgi:hypothetical protein